MSSRNPAPSVGVICLGEAGNLGDDLIAAASTSAIARAVPGADIALLSFGCPIDWRPLLGPLSLDSAPTSMPAVSRELPLTARRPATFASCDAVLFGGGGLLQTSHHPERPYHWLDYLPSDSEKTPALAVGLGIGPISPRWAARLSRLGDPFVMSGIRDTASLSMARDYGWNAELCRDYVDDEFLRLLIPPQPTSNRLGVALRAWPGLDIDDVVTTIRDLARKHAIDGIDYFVLEAKNGEGADVAFTRNVMAEVSALDSELLIYSGASLLDFVERMSRCRMALSMKLHASAIWSHADVPIRPIVYAPKLAAFHGLPYRGLEIVRRPTPRAESAPEPCPRASTFVADRLPAVLQSGAPRRHRHSRSSRLRAQVRGSVESVSQRVPGRGRAGSPAFSKAVTQ